MNDRASVDQSLELEKHRYIVVVGTFGSGKTCVAKALAERLARPDICNDAIIWQPHGQPTPRAQPPAPFDKAPSGGVWTYDDNLLALNAPLEPGHPLNTQRGTSLLKSIMRV